MAGVQPAGGDRVRAAELVGSMSLATDLGVSHPVEHGLRCTLVAMRLADRLGADLDTAIQTYYGCLLFYVGCTAGAAQNSRAFATDDAMVRHFYPVMLGSRRELIGGFVRGMERPETPRVLRRGEALTRLPLAVQRFMQHLRELCEVAEMLSDRLGMPAPVSRLVGEVTQRWDGTGDRHIRGDDLSLALRIIHVARDVTFHQSRSGAEAAVEIVGERSGHAFDPRVVRVVRDDADDILDVDPDAPVWDTVMALEPKPHLRMDDDQVDRALTAFADFADLVSPYLVGHSSGVARLAIAAAAQRGLGTEQARDLSRAALVHDVGRVGVPARIWQKPGHLSPDDWERVRLHGYQSERVLSKAPFLRALAPTATRHHERMDGSGYHRGSTAADLSPAARLLASADAYSAMTEPRAHRPAMSPESAARALEEDTRAGRLDAASAAAVLSAAGQRPQQIVRPAGLTDREAQVLGLIARGFQTKQVGRALGISTKTADHHVQNAYGKIGVSTRAGAAVFAMEHGLATWGELPVGGAQPRA